MFFPKISGIACTDARGAIQKDGKSISFDAPRHIKTMDSQILQEYMQTTRGVYVIGSNTFDQMKGLFKKDDRIIVTSPTHITHYMGGRKVSESEHTHMSDEIVTVAFGDGAALKGDIHVLGGRHVYEAFARHYSHFVHVEIKEDMNGNEKTISVEGNSPRSLFLSGDTKGKKSIWLDTTSVRVIEYNMSTPQ